MRTLVESVSYPCAACKHPFPHNLYARISGDSYPDLKEKFVAGTLFVSSCPLCGADSELTRDFIYHESSPKRYLAYFPNDQRDRLAAFIPQLIAMQSEGCLLHIVRSFNEIRSVIREYDRGGNPAATDLIGGVDQYKVAGVLQKEANEAFDRVAHSIRTGTISPEMVENLKAYGRQRDRSPSPTKIQSAKPSLWQRIRSFLFPASAQMILGHPPPPRDDAIVTSVGILIPGNTQADARVMRLLGVVRTQLAEHHLGDLDKYHVPCFRTKESDGSKVPWGRLTGCRIHCSAQQALTFLAHILHRANAPGDTVLFVTQNGKEEEHLVKDIVKTTKTSANHPNK